MVHIILHVGSQRSIGRHFLQTYLAGDHFAAVVAGAIDHPATTGIKMFVLHFHLLNYQR
jgi:hypothetical protein